MEVILDDETKKDLADLTVKEDQIKTDFDAQMKALDERLQTIQKAEMEAQQKEQNRLQEVQKKQTELLQKARQAEEQLKTKLGEVGDKAKDNLQSGFNAVMQKLNLFKFPQVNVETPDIDLSGISSVLASIPSAISNIEMPKMPEFPEMEPTVVKVDVDTKSLLTEQTGKDIKTALEGKFVNQ